MKFVSVLFPLFAFVLPVISQTTTQTLSYDTTYTASESLNNLACSNGSNGLENKGYQTLGQLPDFPYVGGVYTVTGWNSPACGTCYSVMYGSTTIYILAVDVASQGFNVAQAAMDALTGGQAVQLGRINVEAAQVNVSYCGFN
ncbi:Cerato-platanin [Scleroderma yunnanense]